MFGKNVTKESSPGLGRWPEGGSVGYAGLRAWGLSLEPIGKHMWPLALTCDLYSRLGGPDRRASQRLAGQLGSRMQCSSRHRRLPGLTCEGKCPPLKVVFWPCVHHGTCAHALIINKQTSKNIKERLCKREPAWWQPGPLWPLGNAEGVVNETMLSHAKEVAVLTPQASAWQVSVC